MARATIFCAWYWFSSIWSGRIARTPDVKCDVPGIGEWPICVNGSSLCSYGNGPCSRTRLPAQVTKRPSGCLRPGSSHSSLTVTDGVSATMPTSRSTFVRLPPLRSSSDAGSSTP